MISWDCQISGGDLTFTPEDFDSVTTLGELTSFLTQIILDLRNNNSYGEQARAAVNELEALATQGFSLNDQSAAITQLFHIYKSIIKVSLELRKLLEAKGLSLNIYDSITYALYYNNERWYTENIKPDWLRVTSDGALKLNIHKAVEDIKSTYTSKLNNEIQHLINQHYQAYTAAIWGMYKGGNRLNGGHVAEAFETHLSKDHSDVYKILMNGVDVENASDEGLMIAAEGEITNKYWALHESPNEAWYHIRGALGTQRGTVAGDVGKVQVKQGKDGDQVRLTTLANLKTGIQRYTAIFGTEPAEVVARRIAMYMSENVPKTEKNMQAYGANEVVDKLRNI